MNTEAQILIETQHSKLQFLPILPILPKLLLPTEYDFAKQTQFAKMRNNPKPMPIKDL